MCDVYDTEIEKLEDMELFGILIRSAIRDITTISELGDKYNIYHINRLATVARGNIQTIEELVHLHNKHEN